MSKEKLSTYYFIIKCKFSKNIVNVKKIKADKNEKEIDEMVKNFNNSDQRALFWEKVSCDTTKELIDFTLAKIPEKSIDDIVDRLKDISDDLDYIKSDCEDLKIARNEK